MEMKHTVWSRFNSKFNSMKSRGYFCPVEAEEAYQYAALQMIKVQDKSDAYMYGTGILALKHYRHAEVMPKRELYREMTEKNDAPNAQEQAENLIVPGDYAERASEKHFAALTVYNTLAKLDADAKRGFMAYLEADGNLTLAARIYGTKRSTYVSRFERTWKRAFIKACTWRWDA